MTLTDKIVVLNADAIEQVRSPMELYNRPANVFVAGFIGSPQMNFVPAPLLGDELAKMIGFRPEHLTLSREQPPREEFDYTFQNITKVIASVAIHGGKRGCVRWPRAPNQGLEFQVRAKVPAQSMSRLNLCRE